MAMTSTTFKHQTLATVKEGTLVCVHEYPHLDRAGEEWGFIGIASPTEGGVRYGPEATLYKCTYVWVPIQ